MSSRPNTQRNLLLQALNDQDLARIQPRLEPVVLKSRQRLERTNRKVTEVYFIEAGLASVFTVMRGELQAEIGLMGREAMTGISIVLGAERWPFETIVQVDGAAQKIAADDLRALMSESPTLSRLLYCFAHVFSVQVGYAVLGSAKARVEERLARWLLMAQDRLGQATLALTHEFLATVLGVRRAGITAALQSLESRGHITTARGSITIVDRAGLHEFSNGYYGVPEAEYHRLIEDPAGRRL